MTEEQYRELQKLGEFDTKTSSWIKTPSDVRALGGALFCDRRYGKVFVYHNGAQSYYAARGFRGLTSSVSLLVGTSRALVLAERNPCARSECDSQSNGCETTSLHWVTAFENERAHRVRRVGRDVRHASKLTRLRLWQYDLAPSFR